MCYYRIIHVLLIYMTFPGLEITFLEIFNNPLEGKLVCHHYTSQTAQILKHYNTIN